jgi:hypothetical protein
MTVTSEAPESIDRQKLENRLEAGTSPHIIEFFSARDRMIADRNENTLSYQHGQKAKCFLSRCELLLPQADPLEEWLNSLITGAALIALLIGILCWPTFTVTKTERTKLMPISQTETLLRTQNSD